MPKRKRNAGLRRRPDGPAPGDVVRAQRFEVVDADGNVTAVFGDLRSRDPEFPVTGLAVLDADGMTRASLAFDPSGPNLTLMDAGNIVFAVGVNDPAPDANYLGPYLLLMDAHGVPVISWRVALDGSAVQHLGAAWRD
jgi:hypothetical protein